MTTPAIDDSALDQIRSLQKPGRENLLQKIVGIYVEQSNCLRERIGEAVAKADARELLESAHSLKSSSGNVGAVRVSTLSQKLEAAGRDGRLDGTAALFEELVVELERAICELRSVVGAEAP